MRHRKKLRRFCTNQSVSQPVLCDLTAFRTIVKKFAGLQVRAKRLFLYHRVPVLSSFFGGASQVFPLGKKSVLSHTLFCCPRWTRARHIVSRPCLPGPHRSSRTWEFLQKTQGRKRSPERAVQTPGTPVKRCAGSVDFGLAEVLSEEKRDFKTPLHAIIPSGPERPLRNGDLFRLNEQL